MNFKQLTFLFEQAPIVKYVAFFFIFNLLLISIEFLLDFFSTKKRRWKDSGANIIIFFMNQLLDKTIVGSIGIIALVPLQYFSLFEIPLNFWTWVLAIFIADFTYYWMHRIEHEHRILWASHSVHHSSEDYNLTIAMRLSIVEGLFEWIFLIPMIIIGFSPFQAIVGLVLVAQYQTWIHTERIGKLGWLDEIFNTPSTHRVHHGSNNKYLDKNYGGILILWDKLFGTFRREEEKVIYGLTKNIKTNNPITINFIEYANIYKDVKKCRTLKHKLKMIFGNLVWKPKYFNTSDKN
ncbi:Sterol desaturase/sphingolipid hydroxylase, fatty acid hydroxylase superfamily [Tenacibaculum sp. MAR_2009_124]|uniref:sterol desaturase family protein n=1 Tax=Tenacibaculum sp. MAR_2009_124 TaxID=1250059 RepID=UPI00089D08EB|nr:sterol desaturase family protein [Tenacibaculum sp. MAR_2009_124]SEC43706.1 Sterol desaturase/sphingolipid hydroxylase, fatty acid hydroxylase superfamily [Tenacibaculum sp. MAR_2009_124]